MTRDYKRPGTRRGGGEPFAPWTGFAAGLALGLAVALGVWVVKSRPAPGPVAAEAEPKPEPMSAREEASEKETPGAATDYTFYDKLKNFEVVIPEKEDAQRDVKLAPETRPGSYVLQAGSYRNFADADRIRAQLALQGVESNVQKVTVDSDTWHRVRIGPISDLEQLNRARSRLREAEIDALLIRVGD